LKTARRLVPLVAALLLAACGRGGPAAEARPPLWRVSDGDTTVWLLGSIHLLPANVHWRTPAVERAIAESRELVLESSPDDSADFAGMASGADLPPLAARVPAALRPALDATMKRSGVAAATLDRRKSWAAAATLATGQAVAAGASARHGVERILWDDFAGRYRAAFHRAADQVRALDALPAAMQDRMLVAALDPGQSYAATLRAWEQGDLAALARTDADPVLGEQLVVGPNRRWSRWVAAWMRRPGVVLVAVGAGHLAGADSLPAMLARQGLKVERVE